MNICIILGHVDPGEEDFGAAKREVKEESGLRPDDYDIVDGFNKVLKASTSECKLIQSEQKRWLSLHEIGL